jgi:hypothetical protein
MYPKIKIKQYKNGKCVGRYNSMTDAAKAVNGQESHISECINNVLYRHTHKGYEWRIDYDSEQRIALEQTKD